jgi:hypothetical protein
VPVIVVGQFSGDQQADIRQAADEWNRTLNGHIRFESPGRRHCPPAAAWCWSTSTERLPELRRRPAARVGHVLGFQHDGMQGLMSAIYNP